MSPVQTSRLLGKLQHSLSGSSAALLAQGGVRLEQESVVTATPSDISDDEKLALFESVLDDPELKSSASEVADTSDELVATDNTDVSDNPGQFDETVAFDVPDVAEMAALSQALPGATELLSAEAQQAQAQAAATAGPSKERVESSWSLQGAIQEIGGSLQSVESERTPEISPEVENYLQKVEEEQETPAQKLEAQFQAQPAPPPPGGPPQIVRVLPYTQDLEEVGKRKSTKFALRWLVEWGDKLAKMFKGKVVYRQS